MKAIVALLILAAGLTGSAQNGFSNGNQTILMRSNGTIGGQATRMGNTTYFTNSRGLSSGSATTLGNTTHFTNSRGLSTGSATRM